MWKILKGVLQDPANKQSVSHYLSVAKKFGQFGIGTGGQMSQYLLLKIFKLDKDPAHFYFACGNDNIKNKIHDDHPQFPIESDIVLITVNNSIQGYGNWNFLGPLEAFYNVWKGNIQSIHGLSIKTSNKLSKRDCKTLQVGNIKAYCAGPEYSKYTFGPVINGFMSNVRDQADESDLCNRNMFDQRFFLEYFRHPLLKRFQDNFIRDVKKQIGKRVAVDPVKIQFSDQQAIIFEVPIKDIRQAITINSIMFASDYPLEQGRFYVLNKQGKKMLSVNGDRIMICEGLDKEAVEKDAVYINLNDISQEKFQKEFDGFVSRLSNPT